MVKDEFKLTIPNPHPKEIGVPLLKEILNRAGISRDEWLHRKRITPIRAVLCSMRVRTDRNTKAAATEITSGSQACLADVSAML